MADIGSDDQFRSFQDHCRRALRERRERWRSLLPDGFIQHSRVARREALLAARSLVDLALELYSEESTAPVKEKIHPRS